MRELERDENRDRDELDREQGRTDIEEIGPQYFKHEHSTTALIYPRVSTYCGAVTFGNGVVAAAEVADTAPPVSWVH